MFKIDIGKKITLYIENEDDDLLIIKFLEYKILFDICPFLNNIPGVIFYDHKSLIDLKKDIDIGFVNDITIETDVDEIKINKGGLILYNNGVDKYTNTLTLNFNNNKKLIFYNINNFGLAGSDFFMYKNKELIFRSTL
jgi:hypothetical protein